MKRVSGFLFVMAISAVIASGCSGSKSSSSTNISNSPTSASSKDVTVFSINGINGTITGANIAINVPYNTSLLSLIPMISITGTSINPASGVARNFTGSVTYTVTAQDGTTQNYMVIVTVLPPVTISTVGSGVMTIATYTLPMGTAFKTIQTTPDALSTGISFPTGTSDGTSATITAPFVMAQTQVTYQLWEEVYVWATSSARGTAKYTFANDGQNCYGATNSVQLPVTTINWRDAIVWCNALTEYYNANGGSPTLACVYCLADGSTPIRSCDNGYVTATTQLLGGEDNPNINSTAKGFRLPKSTEYEYAARYRGTDSVNTVTSGGYTNPYYTNPLCQRSCRIEGGDNGLFSRI